MTPIFISANGLLSVAFSWMRIFLHTTDTQNGCLNES